MGEREPEVLRAGTAECKPGLDRHTPGKLCGWIASEHGLGAPYVYVYEPGGWSRDRLRDSGGNRLTQLCLSTRAACLSGCFARRSGADSPFRCSGVMWVGAPRPSQWASRAVTGGSTLCGLQIAHAAPIQRDHHRSLFAAVEPMVDHDLVRI